MIPEILKVKKHKEKRAKSYMLECQEGRDLARTKYENNKKEIEDFKVFRREEKIRLFQKIQNTPVGLKAVDKMNREVALLKDKELNLIEQGEQLRQELKQAQETLEEAKAAYHKAYLEVQKYEELKKEVEQEEKLEVEYKEELEQEPEPKHNSSFFAF